jgi:hypothetical protein
MGERRGAYLMFPARGEARILAALQLGEWPRGSRGSWPAPVAPETIA